jgi:hypothetical protein
MYISDIYFNSNPDCSCTCSTELFLHEEVNNVTKGLMDHVHMDSELCAVWWTVWHSVTVLDLYVNIMTCTVQVEFWLQIFG